MGLIMASSCSCHSLAFISLRLVITLPRLFPFTFSLPWERPPCCSLQLWFVRPCGCGAWVPRCACRSLFRSWWALPSFQLWLSHLVLLFACVFLSMVRRKHLFYTDEGQPPPRSRMTTNDYTKHDGGRRSWCHNRHSHTVWGEGASEALA